MKWSTVAVVSVGVLLPACQSPESRFIAIEKRPSREAYMKFIEENPDDSLSERAKGRLPECDMWESATRNRDLRLIAAYRDSFPSGVFVDGADAHIAAVLDTMMHSTDGAQVRTFVLRNAGIPAIEPVYERLLSIDRPATLAAVLSHKEYSGLPRNIEQLQALAINEGAKERLLAIQALEDIEARQVDSCGRGSRLCLEGKVVENRYAPPPLRYTFDSNSGPYAELPGDHFFFVPVGSNGLISQLRYFDDIDRTILRLKGRYHWQAYLISADRVQPMTFYMLKGEGAVYLRGKGTVRKVSGKDTTDVFSRL